MPTFNLKKVFKQKNTMLINILIITLLILIPIFVYFTGGAQTVYVHLLYIPIILSARNKNIYFVLGVAIVGALLVGPYMPSDTRHHQMQPLQGWVLRGFMFIFVGLVFHVINRKSRKDLFITKLVLHSFKEGVCIIDSSNTIVFTNERFANLHDMKVEDIIHQNIFEFIDKNYTDIHRTGEYYKLVEAIKNKSTKKRLMIPREIDSRGNVVTEYDVNAIRTDDLHGCVIVVNNIENRLDYEHNLYKLSYTDNLTGVNNRRAFQEYINCLDNSKSLPFGVLLIDVDGIKFINDSFGHEKGDEIIIRLASIISRVINKNGYIARYDGDAFIAIIDNASTEKLESMTEKIKFQHHQIKINSLKMSVSCGYGIAKSAKEIATVIKISENNMYLDKLSSKNSLRNNPVDTIINTLHEKDEYSEQHSKSVSDISTNIAKVLALPGNQVNEISQAALLHDIGKIIVPTHILTKEGPLTSEEYKVMQEHPAIGYRLLSSIKNLNNIPDMILAHHEKWDGSGYPKGKKSFQIPLGARIISVADAFNAMTTDRTYRDKLSNEDALSELIRCKGTQFDPTIIDAFSNNFNLIIGS